VTFGRVFWINTFFAWLLFLGIDFLFHAGLLKLFWTEEIAAIKPIHELAALIPFGYFSFLLLTILIGFTFIQSFSQRPKSRNVQRFSVLWGLLFALSYLFGLYSFIEIPLLQLSLFSMVYFIEVTAVCFAFNKLYYAENKFKVRCFIALLFFACIVLGVVFQNLIR
jgi:hypothetical protein